MAKRIAAVILVLVLVSIFSSIRTIQADIVVEDSWRDLAPMSQARGGLGVVSVADKIYAIGGALNCVYNSKASTWQIVNTTEEYNPQTDSWTTKNSMPTSRVYCATVAYQNKIYCFGGLIGTTKAPYLDTEILLPVNHWCNTIEVYDPLADKWETKTPMPLTPNVQLTATVLDDKIFLIGGIGPQPIMVYDPATDQWNTTFSKSESITQSWNSALIHAYATTGASTDDARFTATTYNNSIYAFARGLCLSSTNAGFIYNSLNQSWTLGKPAPSEITGALVVTTSGFLAPKLIYCESFLKANYVYNPKNDSWQIGESLQTNKFDFGMATLNDRIYVVGGYSRDDLLSGVATTEEYIPLGYGSIAPNVSIVSLENITGNDIALNFFIDRPVNWIGYSLDGKNNVTVAGNTTITNLVNGNHTLTIYAKDSFGNIGNQTANFGINNPQTGIFESTLAVVVIAVSAIVFLIMGLLLLRRHRKTAN